MSTTEFTIRNYYQRDIPLDDGVEGEATGQACPVRVRRFTVDQLQAFQDGFARVMHPTAERYIYRLSTDDEQALRPDGRTYVVSAAEVERRRLAEMPPDTRAAYDDAVKADSDFMAHFCSQAIAAHMWVPPGVRVVVIQDDGTERLVTDGAGLVEAFGGNLSMLVQLTKVIHEENTLSPEEKKALRLRFASTPSSPTPAGGAAVDGVRPAATAPRAGREGSASSGDVSADPDPSPSGSTVT